jgi:hypothetical protein
MPRHSDSRLIATTRQTATELALKVALFAAIVLAAGACTTPTAPALVTDTPSASLHGVRAQGGKTGVEPTAPLGRIVESGTTIATTASGQGNE